MGRRLLETAEKLWTTYRITHEEKLSLFRFVKMGVAVISVCMHFRNDIEQHKYMRAIFKRISVNLFVIASLSRIVNNGV